MSKYIWIVENLYIFYSTICFSLFNLYIKYVYNMHNAEYYFFYNVKSYISKIIDIGFPQKKIIDIRFVHIYFVQNNLITLVIN